MSEGDCLLTESQGWEFRLGEGGWFNKRDQMEATLTALSMLPSDEDFERWMVSLRAARVISKGMGLIPKEGR